MGSGAVRGTVERDEAESPLLAHLKAMGWQHIHGPDLRSAEERDHDEIFLSGRLSAALRRLNRLPDAPEGWMGEDDARRAIDDLKRIARNVSGETLAAANEQATRVLLHGILERGPEGQDVKVEFFDWSTEALEGSREEVLARNDFVVVDQLRVRNPNGKDEILDLVLFVNGIPVVVIECKSPDLRTPVTDGIRDLRAYTGRPLDDDTREPGSRPRGIPEFFVPVQLLVAADGKDAVLGTISSDEEHYALWRSIEPDYDPMGRELRSELRAWHLIGADEPVTLQHQLTAMVLKPQNLLNIIRHYVFVMPLKSRKSVRRGSAAAVAAPAPRTAKVVCRHQQYRATEKIVRKLRVGRTRLDPGATRDERGGVVWHTQGAGKSFTMKFLARRLHMSRDPELNQITVVAVTDRKDLQRQLRKAVELSGSVVREAKSQTDLQGMLERAGQHGGRAVIFATIQKFLGDLPGLPKESDGVEASDTLDGEDQALAEDFERSRKRVEAGENPEDVADPAPDKETLKAAERVFPECSDSVKVLVLVDEAHRSHTSVLHACLRKALPNAARVGFTGTPLMEGRRNDTGRIFGFEPSTDPDGKPEFLDTYRMDEAERDGVVVPVRYEGRATTAEVRDREHMDECFEDLIEPLDDAEKERVRRQYGVLSGREVAESVPLIRKKAADMLEHYVTGPLAKGFKAQVAAVSRRAAVLYRYALQDARAQLLAEVREFEDSGQLQSLRTRSPESYDRRELKLFSAWHQQEVLRRMEFVPVISAGKERKSGLWEEWTDEARQRDHIDRFLAPFPEPPPDKPWSAVHTREPNPVPAGLVGSMNPWSNLVWGGSPKQDQAVGSEQQAKPPIAFLIVKSMLLTGFDAPIEQVLYLDRPIQNAELLQAIARVNRPAPEKKEGLVVDYYGVLNHLEVTLAAYRSNPPVIKSLRSMDDEIPGMGEAAKKVEEFFEEVGIDSDGLGTRNGLTRAMRTLDTPELRAEFDRRLAVFLDAVDRVLPHEAALGRIADVRRWALLQMRVRRHYRDASGGGFSMSGYGRKVRTLIAEHLEVQAIEQVIAPVSILAPDFDEIVDRLPVGEAAAEQVQALRYHLRERIEHEGRQVHLQLSEELEKVLKEFEGRWEEIRKNVRPLVERARKAEEADPEIADLTPMERQLYVVLGEKLRTDPRFDAPEPAYLRRLATEVAEEIVSHVTRASFGGEDAHITELEAFIWQRLRKARLAARDGNRAALSEVASLLAGHAARHLESFRAEGRGQ